MDKILLLSCILLCGCTHKTYNFYVSEKILMEAGYTKLEVSEEEMVTKEIQECVDVNGTFYCY